MKNDKANMEKAFVLTIIVLLTASVFIGITDKDETDNISHVSFNKVLGDNPRINLTVTHDNPQPNGGHWRVWIRLEEKIGENWNKTTRDITVKLIRINGTVEELVVKKNYPNGGNGGALLNLSYELPEGNYTIAAGVEIDQKMEWEEADISIPLSSRPPVAVAKVIDGETREKELTITLDRNREASALLDASDSWDPDSWEKIPLNFTWNIRDASVKTNKSLLQWVFREPGNYNISLKAEDMAGMYSEDHVIIHVLDKTYLPDLRVELTSESRQVEVGEEIEITTTIRNTGNDDVWGFDIYYYDVIPDAYEIFKFKQIGLIPFGLNRTFSFKFKPTVEGEHTIRAVVDPLEIRNESNEENNEDSFPLTVTPVVLPEVRINELNYSGSLTTEELTFISIEIRNIGEREAHNVIAKLFINGNLVVEEIIETLGAGKTTLVSYSWVPDNPGLYDAHGELWLDTNLKDNKYLRNMKVEEKERKNTGEDEDDMVMVYSTLSGTIATLAILGIAVTGFENVKYKILGSVVMAPLYTRLKKEDTLNHEVRAKVYDHIIRNPGDNYASILKRLHLKNGTLVHHLRTLEKQRFVKSKKDGKFKRFYPWGTKVGVRDPNYLTDIQENILEIISSEPGSSQAQIAHKMGKSRQSINYQIKVMAKAGLIKVVKHGISTRCYTAET